MIHPTGAIGRFKILRLLGKGNQSEVYLAHDPHLDREVAIKTLHFASSAERAANVDSLLTEARTVSRLQHPNIVTLYAFGGTNRDHGASRDSRRERGLDCGKRWAGHDRRHRQAFVASVI